VLWPQVLPTDDITLTHIYTHTHTNTHTCTHTHTHSSMTTRRNNIVLFVLNAVATIIACRPHHTHFHTHAQTNTHAHAHTHTHTQQHDYTTQFHKKNVVFALGADATIVAYRRHHSPLHIHTQTNTHTHAHTHIHTAAWLCGAIIELCLRLVLWPRLLPIDDITLTHTHTHTKIHTLLHTHARTHSNMAMRRSNIVVFALGTVAATQTEYGVASVSRIDKIICLLCKRAL